MVIRCSELGQAGVTAGDPVESEVMTGLSFCRLVAVEPGKSQGYCLLSLGLGILEPWPRYDSGLQGPVSPF